MSKLKEIYSKYGSFFFCPLLPTEGVPYHELYQAVNCMNAIWPFFASQNMIEWVPHNQTCLPSRVQHDSLKTRDRSQFPQVTSDTSIFVLVNLPIKTKQRNNPFAHQLNLSLLACKVT